MGVARTFGSDAYSPRFPETHYSFATRAAMDKFFTTNEELVSKYYGNRITDYKERSNYQKNSSYSRELDIESPFHRADYDIGMQLRFLEAQGVKPDTSPAKYSDGKIAPDSAYNVNRVLRDQMDSLNLRDEYTSFVLEQMKQFDIDARLQSGRSMYGKPLFKDYTLENAVRIMGKRVKDGEGFNYGLGSIRSRITPQFRSIAAIKKNKDKILDKEEFTKAKEEMEAQFSDLTDRLARSSKDPSARDIWGRHDENLGDLIGRKGSRSWFYEMYEPDDQLMADIAQFADNLKSMPTEYFEVKVKDALSLDQFSKALVPEKTSKNVTDILEKNGIEVVRYKDDADRYVKLQQVAKANTGEAFAGGVVGIEEDEEGELSFDPVKAGIGMAGFTAANYFASGPRKKSDAYLQAEYEVYAEMMELSQPGYKVFLPPDPTRQGPSVIGVPSTFPKWIPEESQSGYKLHSTKLFKEVFPYVENGQRPLNSNTKVGQARQELYDIVTAEITRREVAIDPVAADARAYDEMIQDMAQYVDPKFVTYIPTVRGITGKMPSFAPPRNVKAAIGRNIITPGRKVIKAAEATLLKNRLRAQQMGARKGFSSGRKLERAMQKNIAQNRIDDMKRTGELKRLAQRIQDRETFVNRGSRKGEVETKRYIKEVQTKVADLITGSNLTLNDKGKFLRKLKNIQTVEQLNKVEPAIRARISELVSAQLVRSLRGEITKGIKRSKTTTQSGIRRGKLTAETQRELDFIKDVLKKDRLEGMVEASELAIKHSEDMTPEIARKIDLLRMAGIKTMSIPELLHVADQVQTLLETGRTLNELRAFNRAEDLDRLRAGTLEALGGAAKGTKSVGVDETKAGNAVVRALSAVDNWLQGIDTMLDKLSIYDKTSTGRFDGFLNTRLGDPIHEARQAKNYGMRIYSEEIQNNFYRIFGTKKRRDLTKIVNANKKASVKFEFTNADGVKVSRMLTPNQVYKKYMELQDPSLVDTFSEGMGWTADATKIINDYMDSNPKLKAWADWQLDTFYPEYGQTIAPIYENRFNVPFPARPKYSPIRRTGINTFDDTQSLLEDAYHRASTIPGSLKNRVANNNPLEFVDGDEIMVKHMVEMEHFKAFDPIVRDLRAVFGEPQIKAAMDERFGKSARRIVNRLIDEVARDGMNTAEMVTGLDRLRSNFTISVLGINPRVTILQLSSIPAFITEMPGGSIRGMYDFARYSADFWRNPIKNWQTLAKTEFMRARTSNMDRDIRTAMQTDTYKRFMAGDHSFKNQLMLNVTIGDKMGATFGGWAVYKSNLDAALKKGMSRADAEKLAERKFAAATRRTHQAGEPENLSVLQQTGGSIGKLFSMFLTAPNAYYRIA